VLSPTNPLGIKAGGEGGTTAAPAVVISAILDALRPLGVREIAMPATPFAIWSAIEKAKKSSPAERGRGTAQSAVEGADILSAPSGSRSLSSGRPLRAGPVGSPPPPHAGEE
jgi:hypothetical protein